MNIAIIGSRGFPSTYGGYETLVRHLARALVQAGHETTVYCRTRDEGRRSWVVEDVRCIATAGRDTKSLSTLTFGLTSCSDAAVRNFDATLVLNIANGYFLPILRGRGIPTAVNTDGLEWERGKWGPTARRVFRLGARLCSQHATRLICDSEAMGDVWRERFNRASTFIPYGAPVLEDVPDERVTSLGLTPGTYVLVVARLIPENNVELTLDAVEQMLPKPRLVVVGSANYNSPLEHRLQALERDGGTNWLGHVDDQRLLTQLWSHCGVYVHGHSVGGTNPALLQALGGGAPVLALNTPFNREVLRADDQLYPNNPGELAARIEDCLRSADLRNEFRRRGRAIVSDRYQWETVTRAYMTVLQEIADEGRRGRALRRSA